MQTRIFSALERMKVPLPVILFRHPSAASRRTAQLIPEPLPNRAFCSEKLDWYEFSWHDTGSRGIAWLGEQFYLNLFDVIRNHAALEVPPEHVRRQIAIMEECFRQNPQKWSCDHD